jgi:uncharacterized protein (TIGR04222 family)
MDILDLRGPEFLAFYAGAAMVAVAVGLLLRRVVRGGGARAVPAEADELDATEVAYLAGGPRLAINTAIAGLYRRNAVRIAGSSGKSSRSLEAAQAVLEPLPALERQVLRYVAGSSPARIYDLHRHVSAESARRGPMKLGLLLPTGLRIQGALLGALPTVLLLLLGLMKISVGTSRHRPVGVLIVFCFFTVVAIFLMLALTPRRTVAGDRVLRALRSRHAALRSTAISHPNSLAAGDLALAMGLFGVVVLQTGGLGDLRAAIGPPAAGGSCGGGGCGSGGCGGGGCGGCGGGGCGS